ncbi:patatin-like phospholipase family protein [Paenibacillus spiritus]|uniref:Patatin-like phospholipase family protein n=1 Tax=Paenibacillus spiritus TaxID=2496557 RepID=A0A5J5GIH8_9BACL|nr:patatin-like phospholipase family protein [Paenibacillus spiritus]KAA9007498.1 patatin-like phospholipase family protein [Paenibacillus spiritus]
MRINGVFEGGGVKGIALAGAVQACEEAGCVFHRVAGTSSGSIVASLLAAGYTGEEMGTIIRQTSFRSFLRRAPIFNTALLGPALRVMLKKGLYSGEALEAWIRGILRKKGVVTFRDLPKDRLRIIASDISDGRLVVLPDGLRAYGIDPDAFEVAKAVRISCSIPYFFDPVVLRRSGDAAKGRSFADQLVYMVDGGLLSNFPIWLFEGVEEDGGSIPPVGFQMVGRPEPAAHRIRGPFSMLQAMVGTMLSAHDERYIEQEKRMHTVKVPTLGIRTVQFELTSEESSALYAAGYEAGAAFFRGWRYPC